MIGGVLGTALMGSWIIMVICIGAGLVIAGLSELLQAEKATNRYTYKRYPSYKY